MINYSRLGYEIKRRGERFVIRVKKDRNVIYNGETCHIMDAALQYKGAYRMDFKSKSDKSVQCIMSCVPVRPCKFPSKELVLTIVYGFGEEPLLLLSILKIQEKKKLCHIITKVYLLRWRIEEYFRFKSSKRIYKMSNFIFYTIVYALERVLSMCRSGISGFLSPKVRSQVHLSTYSIVTIL